MYKGENLSVIIAAYNEEENIVATIKRVHKSVPKAEILVVVDGSPDNTAKEAKSVRLPNLQVISYMPNRGKGYAIRIGVLNATREIQAQIDADSQFPPEELGSLVKPIMQGDADITFCSRFCEGATIEAGSLTRMRRLANYIVSGFTSLLAWRRLTDVNAGFKAWKTDVMKDIDIRCPHFGYEPEIAIMASKKGYTIKEVPVNYKNRDEGNTSVSLWRDGIIIPAFLIKTKLFR